MDAAERFLKYVTFDTQSDPASNTVPSTEKQLVLARELARELCELGAEQVELSEYGVVTATVPATAEHLPVVGFIAHYDTSPDLSGQDVKPRIWYDYDGSDVVLDAERGIVMRAAEYTMLADSVGQDLIVTDGHTLLGADDKAGVAEIMTMTEALLNNRQLRHGVIRIAFTPDEEIGRGAEHLDVAAFGARFAYTVDGGPVGELEYENFNGVTAKVCVEGFNIHPGTAKGKMLNAASLAMDYHAMLPPLAVPENTEGYEGFLHLMSVRGEVEHCALEYLVRDHDAAKLEEKKRMLLLARDLMNTRLGRELVTVEFDGGYRNMKEMILPHFEIVENARRVMEEHGITPIISPIRGGTDGARLSWEGLPCPNLGTGGNCGHGRFEHITVQSLERVTRLLIALACAQKPEPNSGGSETGKPKN